MKIHTPDGDCPIVEEEIQKAVEAFIKAKNEVAPNGYRLQQYLLSITLHKVPAVKNRVVVIKLPNPLYNRQSNICVFVDEKVKGDKETATSYWQSYFKEKLGITPRTISFPRQLSSLYPNFKKKRDLAASHDIFIADKNISKLSFKSNLEKTFRINNKMPLQMKMTGDNFSNDFDEVLSCTKWNIVRGHISRGEDTFVQVGKAGQSVEELVANIQSVLSVVSKTVDRGWANIKKMELKTGKSISVPVYENLVVDESLNEMSQNEKLYFKTYQQLQLRKGGVFVEKEEVKKKLKRKQRGGMKNVEEKIIKTEEAET